MVLNISSIISQLSWSEGITSLANLVVFLLGIVVYSVFVFYLYRFIGKRDIFKIDFAKLNRSNHPFVKKITSLGLYILENIFFLPFIIFIWFVVFAFLLTILTNSLPVETILTITIALIGAIRVTSYFNEDLSKDIAKLIPFTLLGIFLIDLNRFAGFNFIASINELPAILPNLIYYFIGIIILELVLSITHTVTSLSVKVNEVPTTDTLPGPKVKAKQ